MKAEDVFHQTEKRYNCAQSVLKLHAVEEEKVDEFKAFGGGRAPEGVCGALHAALDLLHPDTHEEVRSEFKEHAGSEKCREIRQLGKLSCLECVKLGAKKVHEKIK